jgi:hypothetical protein
LKKGMDGAGERQKEKERDNNVRWPFKWRKGSLNGGSGAVGSLPVVDDTMKR